MTKKKKKPEPHFFIWRAVEEDRIKMTGPSACYKFFIFFTFIVGIYAVFLYWIFTSKIIAKFIEIHSINIYIVIIGVIIVSYLYWLINREGNRSLYTKEELVITKNCVNYKVYTWNRLTTDINLTNNDLDPLLWKKIVEQKTKITDSELFIQTKSFELPNFDMDYPKHSKKDTISELQRFLDLEVVKITVDQSGRVISQ